MKETLLDHALFSDTDDLPGGGGYSLLWASPGASEEDRRFVADHPGISDYLHDRANARMYFSFLQIARRRYAFIRRFANGTRRNGTQSRLFVHTVFLSEDDWTSLFGFPWLLADIRIRPAKSSDWTSLAKLLGTQARNEPVDSLHWEPPSREAAYAALRRRLDALSSLLPLVEPQQQADAQESIARVATSLCRDHGVVLPQGLAFEQLTLLAWSVVPIDERATLSWTQHDDSIAGLSEFHLVNSPFVESDLTMLVPPAPDYARSAVSMTFQSVSQWVRLRDAAREFGLRWNSPRFSNWIQETSMVFDAPEHPGADDIARVLSWITQWDLSQPWSDPTSILHTVWTVLLTWMGENSGAPGQWPALAAGPGVRSKVFYRVPSTEWLDTIHTRVGGDLLILLFLEGTGTTREVLGNWILSRASTGLEVSAEALVQLILALAVDTSKLVEKLLEYLINRANGLKALVSAMSAVRPELADAILMAMVTVLEVPHEDAALFATNVFIPYVKSNAFTTRVPRKVVRSTARVLRDTPDALADFAFALDQAGFTEVMTAVREWLGDDRNWRGLARTVLQRAVAVETTNPAVVLELAFCAAAAGEESAVWVPIVAKAAISLDRTGSPRSGEFAASVLEIVAPLAGPTLAGSILGLIRAHAALPERVGPCLRSLLIATRGAWPETANAAATIAAIVGSALHRAVEWEGCVLALVESHPADPYALHALATFFTQLMPIDVPRLQDATLIALRHLSPAEADPVVSCWISRLGSVLGDSKGSVFVHGLREVASSPMRASLDLALMRRDIDRRVASSETFTRMSVALRIGGASDRWQILADGIIASATDDSLPRQLIRLLELFAARRTLPSTRTVMEKRVMPDVLSRLTAVDWQRVLVTGQDALFAVPDYLLVELARRVVSLKHDGIAQQFAASCLRRERWAAVDALVAWSRGRGLPVVKAAVVKIGALDDALPMLAM